MSKKKVLVTGLNGVVGTALRPSFEEKYELSSFSRHGCDDMPDERNHLGNLNDLDSVIKAFKGQDTVVHLAADRSMKAEWDTVLPYNIVGLYNVFEAAKVCGVKRVVFGSYDDKKGACGSLYEICGDKRIGSSTSVNGGVMEKECTSILKEFFSLKRDS